MQNVRYEDFKAWANETGLREEDQKAAYEGWKAAMMTVEAERTVRPAEDENPTILELFKELVDCYVKNPGTRHQFIACITPEVTGTDAMLRYKHPAPVLWEKARRWFAQYPDGVPPRLEDASDPQATSSSTPEPVGRAPLTDDEHEAGYKAVEVRLIFAVDPGSYSTFYYQLGLFTGHVAAELKATDQGHRLDQVQFRD